MHLQNAVLCNNGKEYFEGQFQYNFLTTFEHVSACFVSDAEDHPWMTVDLGQETPISTIIIMSRDIESRYHKCIMIMYQKKIPTYLIF